MVVGLGGAAPAWGQSNGEGQPVAPPSQPAPQTNPSSPATGRVVEQPGEAPTSGEAPPPPATYGTRRKLVIEEPAPYQDPKRFTISFAAGYGTMSDVTSDITASDGTTSTVTSAFTFDSPALRFQVGRQFHDQFQLQLDLSRIGFSTTDVVLSDLSTSNESTLLKQYSASLGFAYRFDYVDEQPLVPYLAVGVMDTLGAFTQDQPTGATTEYLNRFGGYVGGGLEILLDVFEPARAADLELSSGINDTYLIIDARYNWQPYLYDSDAGSVTRDNGLQYTGFQITAGLKFDF